MFQLRSSLLGLFLGASLLTGCAAQQAAYDANFQSAEFGLGPLAPGTERTLGQQAEDLFSMLKRALDMPDLGLQSASTLKADVQTVQTYFQSLMPGQSAAIEVALEPYRNLAREPVGYYQIPQPRNPALQVVTVETNALLKRYYRMLSGLKLGEALIVPLRKEVPQLSQIAGPQHAALGLVAATYFNLNLQAQAELNSLQPDLIRAEVAAAKALNQLREQLKTNPTRTNPVAEPFVFYAALTSNLSTANQNLSKIETELPLELVESADLLRRIAKLL